MRLMNTVAALALLPAAAFAQEVTTSTDLNIRSGPGLNAGVVGVIPASEIATLEGCVEGTNWCQVTYDGVTGFAAASYLSNADATAIDAAAAASVEVDGLDAETVVDIDDTVFAQQGAAESFAISNPATGPAEYNDYTVMVGDMLPEGIIIQDIPDNDLGYARVGQKQVIVNPVDRSIVSIATDES